MTRPEPVATATPTLRLRRAAVMCLALCAVALLGSLAGAPSAHAHAELIGTTPADGERLDAPPRQVVLEFTEQVRPVRDGIRLLDAAGVVVATPEPGIDGSAVTVPLPELDAGGYVLSWRVVSRDTHPVSGAFSFGVRADPVDAAGVAPESTVAGGSAVMSVLRWLGFAGLALLLGGTAFLLLCWPAGRRVPAARRVVWTGWAVVALAAVAAIPTHAAHVAGTGISDALIPTSLADTLTSQFGVLHLARLGLLAAAVPLLLRRALRPDEPPRWPLAALGGVLAGGVAATFAGTGHSASGIWPAVALVSDTVHLSAVSLWVGGLVFLAVYALRLRHVDGLGGGLVRFSRLATAVVATLVVTGAFQAWRTVGSLDALGASSYGRLLLVKIALVAVVFAIGGLSLLAARGERPTRLRRTVPLEAGVAAVILAVTAILVITPPARQSEAEQAGGPQSEVLALPEGGAVQLKLAPGVVGSNELNITVADRGGAARDVAELTVKASLPGRDLGPFDVHVIDHGAHFVGHITLPFPDEWRFDLTVRTSELDAYVVSTTMSVGAARS